MAKVEYLTKRGDTYYVRISVPDTLRATVGQRELKRSLKTKSKTEAIKQYPAIVAELLAMLQGPGSDRPSDKTVEARELDLQQLFEKVHDETFAAELAMRERVFRCLSNNQEHEGLWDFHEVVPDNLQSQLDRLLQEGDVVRLARFLSKVRGKYHVQSLRQRYEIGDTEDLSARAIEIVGAAADKTNLYSVMRTLMEAEIAALEALDQSSQTSLQAPSHVPAKAMMGGNNHEKAIDQGPMLADAIKRWVDLNEWSPKTLRERETVMGFFSEICGHRPVGSYTKEDGRKTRDVFRSVPPNAHKMKAFAGLSIQDISRKAQAGNYRSPAPKNVNDKLNVISAFFNWAQGEYDSVGANPIQGLKLRVDLRAREQREPFTVTELNQLFRSPVFTGCLSKKHWAKPGDVILKDSYLFWVPLIALFSGMRLAEIVFLELDDIDDIDGVRCFRVRETPTRRLKTFSSKRDIPIHHMLVKLGLLDFVNNHGGGGPLLFDEAEFGPEDNPISPESKRFNRLLDKAGLARNRTSFHSFRHTFEDGCRNSGIPPEIMSALQGHSERGMAGRYGRGHSIVVLNEHLQKLDYNGLVLEHLIKP